MLRLNQLLQTKYYYILIKEMKYVIKNLVAMYIINITFTENKTYILPTRYLI